MKRISPYSTLIAIGIVTVVAWVPQASAYENEPTGFGGLEWGAPVPDDMTFVSEDPITWERVYTRSSDSLQFGGVSAKAVYYAFNWTGKLYKVEIHAAGQNDEDEFMEYFKYLESNHGNAYELTRDDSNTTMVWWRGKTTTISLTHDTTEDPPESYVAYIGIAVVEEANKMIEAALEAVGGTAEETNEQEQETDEEEEDLWKDLFD